MYAKTLTKLICIIKYLSQLGYDINVNKRLSVLLRKSLEYYTSVVVNLSLLFFSGEIRLRSLPYKISELRDKHSYW